MKSLYHEMIELKKCKQEMQTKHESVGRRNMDEVLLKGVHRWVLSAVLFIQSVWRFRMMQFTLCPAGQIMQLPSESYSHISWMSQTQQNKQFGAAFKVLKRAVFTGGSQSSWVNTHHYTAQSHRVCRPMWAKSASVLFWCLRAINIGGTLFNYR